jgi:hypothetical protein
MLADQQVLHGAHLAKQPDILICAGDTEPCDAMRGRSLDLCAQKVDRARRRMIQSADVVDERRFARTIRANQPHNFALRHTHRHRIQRLQATKPARNVLEFQHRQSPASANCVLRRRSRFQVRRQPAGSTMPPGR